MGERQPDSAAERVERLRALTHSPFPPQPPRRSRLVDTAMALARRLGHRQLVTPHLHHGDDMAKAAYEEAGLDDFWATFRGHCSPAVLSGREVADIGCGWGGKTVAQAQRYSPRSIVGFDLAEVFDPAVARAFAELRGVADRCSFTVGSAEDMPLATAAFDVAIMDDVLEHVRDPERVISECRRILRPGGILIVKFPSVRMMGAHHLDRALTWPGLHFVAPLRTWAAGLNDYLLRNPGLVDYEPFDAVAPTRYHRGVTQNLNGLGFQDFSRLIQRSGLTVETLEVVRAEISRTTPLRRLLAGAYDLATRLPALRERLGVTIAFVGRR